MELATSIGITISEFWEITPYELSIAVRGFCKRKEREAEEYSAKYKQQQKDLIYQAYLISRWVWAKKVDIEKILNVKPKQKNMSDEEMLAQVKALNTLFGGEVVINGEK